MEENYLHQVIRSKDGRITDAQSHQSSTASTSLSSVSFSPVSPSSSSTGGFAISSSTGGFASAGRFAGAASISDGFAAVASGGAASGSGFAAVGTWEPTRYRWYFSFFPGNAGGSQQGIGGFFSRIIHANEKMKFGTFIQGLEIFTHK